MVNGDGVGPWDEGSEALMSLLTWVAGTLEPVWKRIQTYTCGFGDAQAHSAEIIQLSLARKIPTADSDLGWR